ncbi:MAG: 30S ribosomal protein S20 [Planctomycetes bacterium]|nr:30S ribosomal protein S20 [Planctomycetota bacterium]
MAHSAQAKKRIRQSEQRRSVNRSRKSEIRTLTRRLFGLVEQKDAAAASVLLRDITSKLDKAARKNLYHKNNVARKKSHLAALVNRLGS